MVPFLFFRPWRLDVSMNRRLIKWWGQLLKMCIDYEGRPKKNLWRCSHSGRKNLSFFSSFVHPFEICTALCRFTYQFIIVNIWNKVIIFASVSSSDELCLAFYKSISFSGSGLALFQHLNCFLWNNLHANASQRKWKWSGFAKITYLLLWLTVRFMVLKLLYFTFKLLSPKDENNKYHILLCKKLEFWDPFEI